MYPKSQSSIRPGQFSNVAMIPEGPVQDLVSLNPVFALDNFPTLLRPTWTVSKPSSLNPVFALDNFPTRWLCYWLFP